MVARPAPVDVDIDVVEVIVPNDYRVLSLPIDERVPELEPGDRIDLYLETVEAVGVAGAVEALDDAGIVTAVDESAFSVAVAESNIARIAAALRGKGVLVVRR